MSNYTIGLSGLRSNNSAIDVISNNIANASTVGYKAGEYIFEDQFYKAINPLDPARAGQGTAKQNIRRLFNMGSVQESANTLDMAITGALGMFRLASNVDPDEIYYTRNGQFAVSKETDPNFPKRSYIVNENGMFLTGYASENGTDLKDEWTARLTMPPTSLDPKTTTQSNIAVNLDARTNAFITVGSVPFNPEVATSYNHRVSQTIYSADDNGGAHTLTVYYRRVDDADMTVSYDGANFYYAASQEAKNVLSGDESNVVLTGETTDGKELVSEPHRSTVATVATTTATITVETSADINQYARVLKNGEDLGKGVVSTATGKVVMDGAVSVADGDTLEFFNPAATASGYSVTATTASLATTTGITVGDYVYYSNAGVLTRLMTSASVQVTVSAVSSGLVTFSGDPSDDLGTAGTNKTLVFFNPVSYRLTLQDGSEVTMNGDLFRDSADQTFTAVTSKYEVYASLDGKFFDSTDTSFYSNSSYTTNVGNSTVYDQIAELQFWGGKNIDAMVTDETTGLSTFKTAVNLTGKVTTPGNSASSTDPSITFELELTGTRNLATPFGVDQSTQNGRSVALLNSVSIDDEGKIVGTYGDGRNFTAGQLVLVNFAATNGLVPTGGNAFQATYLSGDEVTESVIVGKPGQKGLGGIRAGAVEGSNVDLANELVKLLIQQRMYSANSQAIRAFDDTLTTTIRMTGG